MKLVRLVQWLPAGVHHGLPGAQRFLGIHEICVLIKKNKLRNKTEADVLLIVTTSFS